MTRGVIREFTNHNPIMKTTHFVEDIYRHINVWISICIRLSSMYGRYIEFQYAPHILSNQLYFIICFPTRI